jgi:hypothetical protein
MAANNVQCPRLDLFYRNKIVDNINLHKYQLLKIVSVWQHMQEMY